MKNIIITIFLFSFFFINPVFAVDNDYSATFDSASSQYLSILDGVQTGLDIQADLTFAFWVKPASLDSLATFVSKFDAGQSARAYELGFASASGDLTLTISQDGSSAPSLMHQWTSSVNLSVDVWTYVVVVFNIGADNASFYFNGVLDNSSTKTFGNPGSLSSILNNNHRFAIGADFSNGVARRFFNGKIDEFQIFDDIRTQQEITDGYNSGDGFIYSSTEASQQGYWRMENNADDADENVNDLTNNNSVVFTTDVPFEGSVGEPPVVATSTKLVDFLANDFYNQTLVSAGEWFEPFSKFLIFIVGFFLAVIMVVVLIKSSFRK